MGKLLTLPFLLTPPIPTSFCLQQTKASFFPFSQYTSHASSPRDQGLCGHVCKVMHRCVSSQADVCCHISMCGCLCLSQKLCHPHQASFWSLPFTSYFIFQTSLMLGLSPVHTISHLSFYQACPLYHCLAYPTLLSRPLLL